MIGSKLSKRDTILGTIVLIGVLFIYASLPPADGNTHKDTKMAVILGVIAAALAAVFTILNKIWVNEADPTVLNTIEIGAGAVILSVIVPCMDWAQGSVTHWYPQLDFTRMNEPRSGSLDLLWVLIMALLCTNLTMLLSTYSLKHLSAFQVVLACNMEPVYGIIMGAGTSKPIYSIICVHAGGLKSPGLFCPE